MKGRYIAACMLALALLTAAPRIYAAPAMPLPFYETVSSGGDGGAGVSVLPPPASSEHGLCGGGYCETTPNPATETVGDGVWIVFIGGAAGVGLLLSLAALRLRRRKKQ